VGIDLPDEGDAADGRRVQEGVARDGPAVLDEARDREARHAEHRAAVEAAYRAHRAAPGSWDAELPGLRQAWAELDEKIHLPERSRDSPQPETPGAWRGDGGRYLDPETNAEVDRGYERIRDIGENVIAPGMRNIEGADPDRHLIGFEHRLKGADRIKEKVANQLRSTPGLSSTQALSVIPDAVRFTFQYNEGSYTADVRADIERLQDSGFRQVELRNTWTSEQYRGINGRWREPQSGQLFEVQFHTPASFEAKQLTHEAYERLRNPATSDDERGELNAFQSLVCDKIRVPPGTDEIADYRPEQHDG
jgi:hypothetical protein